MVSAVLACAFVTCFVAYLQLIGDRWTVRDTLLACAGTAAMVGAIGFFIAGLLTPRTHGSGTGTAAATEGLR